MKSRAARFCSAFLLLECAGCWRQEPSEPTAAPRLIDGTAAAGLDFIHYTGATGEYYLPEIMGSGAGLFDYDNDGDLDILLLQGALLGEGKTLDPSVFPPARRPSGAVLLRNRLVSPGGAAGTLSFEDVTAAAGLDGGGYGMGCAVGDYDNDGFEDLYITRYGANGLYRNNGSGAFIDASNRIGAGEGRLGASAAFVDYDRDGFLDLFVTSYTDFTLASKRDCFRLGGQADYCGPKSYGGAPNRLYHNRRDGGFEDVSSAAGIWATGPFYSLGVAAADFDGDGWLDIFVANDATPNQLWINRCNGAFEDRALFAGVAVNYQGQTEACMGIAAGDFDNDGDEDIFVTNETGEKNTLYRNLGKGLFEDASFPLGLAAPSIPFTGFGTGWFDCDNDGWLDCYVANGAVRKLPGLAGAAYPFHQPDQLYLQQGGRFAVAGKSAGPAVAELQTGRGVAFGDVDNDGDVDLLISNSNGPARLLLNAAGNRSNWLRFLLIGKRSNRDGLGARVKLLLPGGEVRWQRAATDGSYLSAGDRRVHFGIGSAREVESATVFWPSGTVEKWARLPVNAQTVLREGEGQPAER